MIPAALEVKIHMTSTACLYFKIGKQFIHSLGITPLWADCGVTNFISELLNVLKSPENYPGQRCAG